MIAPAITLLTDFGTADGYVAEMKGVLTTLAQGIPLLDLTHDVPAQDVAFARLTLARYWRRFPVGTVHVAIVDPGVGTSRAAIAVCSEGRFLVGPDNGVLSPALFALDARVVSLTVDAKASPTFHGRDIFAPAAALLARGASMEMLGEPYIEPVRLRTPQPRRTPDGTLHGEILTIDRFGNAITNLAARDGVAVQVGGHEVRLVRTYGEAAPGELIALVGSSGFVEIAVRDGHAAARVRLSRGQPVELAAMMR
ncbi:S-adenosyl-l-methionine hydroxide adenosyltransferase family protein [Gemmatimonas sp.]|uniref:SAM hydrolase/SAM-dependent halogenase family protein n=1 Tax=Gemmatimonas sp. TaxID=1962908 RepID=UPI00356691D0